MKRLLCAAGVLGLAVLGSAMYISETQAIVEDGLKSLGFQVIERTDGVVGAPTELAITEETIKQLETLKKEGNHIRLAADGRITVIKPAANGQGR